MILAISIGEAAEKIIDWLLNIDVILFDALVWVVGKAIEFNDALQTAQNAMASGSIGTYFGSVNRIIPLSEFVSMWGALLTLQLGAMVLRWARSLIPGGFGG